MRKLALLTLLFLYPIFSTYAYEEKDTIWAIQILAKINDKIEQNNYDGMLLLINKALPVFKTFAATNVNHYADCYVDLGFYYEQLGDYKKALANHKKALDIYLRYSGNHLSKIADSYDYIGWIYGKLDDVDNAILYLKKSIKIFKAINGNPSSTMYSLGAIYEKKGDFKKALDFHEKSLSYQLEQTDKDFTALGSTYESIGICFFNLENYPKALSYFAKAQTIYEDNLGSDHAFLIDIYTDMGRCYLEMKNSDYQKAESYFQLAYKNALSHYQHNELYLIDIYYWLAKTYLLQNRLEEAKTFAQKEIKANSKTYGQKSQNIASGELMLARCYEKEADTLAARQTYENALNSFPKNEKGNIIAEQIKGLNKYVVLDIFSNYSNFLIKQYAQNKDANALFKAKDLLEQAVSLIDYMLASFDASGSKAALIAEYFFIFENSIHVYNQLWELEEEEQYLTTAFQLAVKSKNLVLQEALRKSDIESFVNISPLIVQQESALKMEISNLEKQLFFEQEKENADAKKITTLKNKCFDTRIQYDSLIRTININYPGYFRLKYKNEVLSIEEIQKELLAPNQSAIEYFVGDSTIYIFVLDQDDLQIRAIPNDFQLQQKVKDFRLSISHPNSFSEDTSFTEQYIHISIQLYQKLIEPVAPFLKERLIIIPDGVLGYIPFEALLLKRPDNVMDFRTYPYLMNQKTISYSYTMSLLKEQKNKLDTIAQKNLIAFAPEFKAKDERLNLVFRQEFLSSLKYNRKEIKGISKWIKADLLTNEDATKENFLKLSPMYKIIHLATHGQANNKRGEYSFLAFSAANDSIELLHASDLYNIDLPAELIVLSACETGVGELKRGEGILSLARGFSFAGVKSILTTLWKVSDKKAASFMDFFYKNISEGLQKDEALRKAKIAYMANCSKREAAPFYWASYIAMGDMDAIELFPEPEESFLLWYILSGLCIVGMALSFYLWREKLVEISRRPVSSIAGWFRR